MWKMASINEYSFNKDGEIYSVIIQSPNKQLVSRAINHLFPLEMQTVDHKCEDVKTAGDEPVVNFELKSDSWYLRKEAVQVY